MNENPLIYSLPFLSSLLSVIWCNCLDCLDIIVLGDWSSRVDPWFSNWRVGTIRVPNIPKSQFTSKTWDSEVPEIIVSAWGDGLPQRDILLSVAHVNEKCQESQVFW